MDKAAQAEEKIKRICDRLQITPGGRLWMDVALDPFKDLVQKPIGFPDRNMAPSVIQTVHDSIDIKAPDASGSNWDCNIFLDTMWRSVPLRKTSYTLPGNRSMLNATAQSTIGYNRGGMIVRSAVAGTPLTMETTRNASCLSYVTDVFSQNTSARIIAIGLEVHNTTASLHKQGSVIVYRLSDDPAKYVITPVSSAAGSNQSLTLMAVDVVEPPTTASKAIDLPGSLQWDASKGVYVVPLFSSEDNPATDLFPLAVTSPSPDANTTYAPAIETNSNTLFFRYQDADNACVPITLSGAFFTGLSAETALTVNLTYYIEQFPSVDSTLKRVSSPSCPEDFAALELYTKIARELPCGVEVNDNFLGAFVSGVARIASQVAPYIPRALNVIGAATNFLGGSNVPQVTELSNNRGNRTNSQALTVAQRPTAQQSTLSNALSLANNVVQAVTNRPTRTLAQNPSPSNRAQNRGAQAQTVKNKRDKNYNRFNRYLLASQAGNRHL